jgi:hypothetical protein
MLCDQCDLFGILYEVKKNSLCRTHVCPSVCDLVSGPNPSDSLALIIIIIIIIIIRYGGLLLEVIVKFQSYLNKNKGHFTCRPACVYLRP